MTMFVTSIIPLAYTNNNSSAQARRTQLVTHEALKGVAHPTPTYAVCELRPRRRTNV